MTEAQETFARALAAGRPRAVALREAYPATRSWADSAVYPRASRLAKSPRIVARVAELREGVPLPEPPAVTVAPVAVEEAATPPPPPSKGEPEPPTDSTPPLPLRVAVALAKIEAAGCASRQEAWTIAAWDCTPDEARAVVDAWEAKRRGDTP